MAWLQSVGTSPTPKQVPLSDEGFDLDSCLAFMRSHVPFKAKCVAVWVSQNSFASAPLVGIFRRLPVPCKAKGIQTR